MESVIRFPVYRCERCGRLVTRLAIRKAWAAAGSMAVCSCGSRRISPTNPSLWEELTSPAIWKQAWTDRYIYNSDGSRYRG
jgi:DNA-directed RNA polymerase subunit RPC12/RpoP